MNQKIKTRKGFISIVIMIAVIIIAGLGISCGIIFLEASSVVKESQQLSQEGKYDEAIELLGFYQNKWFLKNLGIEQVIDSEIEKNRQLSKDYRNYNEGIEKIKVKDWNGAKELLESISENFSYYSDAEKKVEILNEILNCEYRKGEYIMRIFDSEGRVTGIVDGEVKEEIPNSIYDKKTNMAAIFSPSDSYTYEFFAVKEGNYQFTMVSVVDGEATEFYLENIPIQSGNTHRIEIDKEAIDEGKMDAVLLIDADSNGKFEEKVIFSKKLTCEEFIVQTKMPEIEKESSESDI
jgi:hypothetical protein